MNKSKTSELFEMHYCVNSLGKKAHFRVSIHSFAPVNFCKIDSIVPNRRLIFNRNYNKILDFDWFCARHLSRNQRAITWVSNYRYPI